MISYCGCDLHVYHGPEDLLIQICVPRSAIHLCWRTAGGYLIRIPKLICVKQNHYSLLLVPTNSRKLNLTWYLWFIYFKIYQQHKYSAILKIILLLPCNMDIPWIITPCIFYLILITSFLLLSSPMANSLFQVFILFKLDFCNSYQTYFSFSILKLIWSIIHRSQLYYL